MKTQRTTTDLLLLAGSFFLCAAAPSSGAQDIVKAANGDALNLPGSWVGGIVPASTNRAVYVETATARTTVLGGNLAWSGLVLNNNTKAWTISAGNALALGSGGIDMAAAKANLTLDPSLQLAAAQAWTVGAARTLIVNGAVSGSSGNQLVKDGTGTLVLNNASNTYAGGTVVNSGTLTCSQNNPVGTGMLTLNDGAVFTLSNKILTNAVSIPAGQNATIIGNATLNGPLSGSGSLTHGSSGAFKLTLGGDNSGFSGSITNTSTLAVKHRNALGTGTLYLKDEAGLHSSLAANSELRGFHALTNPVVLLDTVLIGATSSTGNFELKGAVSGGGGLMVNHRLVTLTLGGACNYAGQTDIAQGGLLVNGSVQSPLVTAAAGTRLGGTGTVQRVEMNAGSTLAIGGDTPGTMTFLGDLSFAAGATNTMKIFGASSHDVLMGAGTNSLSLDGTVLLDFSSDLSVDAGDEFALFQLYQSWGGLTLGAGTGFVATGLPGSLAADFSTIGSDGTIRIVAAQVDPIALPEHYPISMTYHGPKPGTNTVADELLKYEHVEVIGAVADGVWDAVRSTFPDKIVLKQDAWGGTVSTGMESAWPGHWLLKTGTKLSADCAESDTVLQVENYLRLAKDQAAVTRDLNNNNSYLMIYALDGEGKPDWSRAEHVKITAVDTANGSVTVVRAQQGSSALEFSAGQAVIARHMLFWYNNPGGQWQLNFSLQCPRGGSLNLTAAEWFARHIKKLIDDSGADGVEFDVARWQWGSLGNNTMDCDNDLVTDYGYIDGVQSFGLGGQVFLRELRRLLGPGKIIQMDSNGAVGQQRGWQYANGVQLESFPNANQFDRFSEAFLHFRRWTENVEALPKFSYAYVKTPNTTFENLYDNGENIDWHFRTGFAAGLLAGMPSPFSSIADENFDPGEFDPDDPYEGEGSNTAFYKWDEYVGGHLDDWKWLGRPVGAAVQLLDGLENSNLLAQAAWSWTVDPAFTAACAVASGEYSAEVAALASVAAIPPSTIGGVTYYPGTSVPKILRFGVRLGISSGAPVLETNQEYTIEFEATGNDQWNYAGQVFEKVPRMLAILNPQGEEINVLIDSQWRPYRLSFFCEDPSVPLVFGVSEQVGSAAIRNIRLDKGGAERWTREFEQGRVYLNMTKTPWTVDVGTGVLQRLLGTQNPDVHDGQVVNGTLTVPSWDAAFLRTWTYDAWQSAQFGMAVSDDFSTGFGGRDPGDALVGFPVQVGAGSWANAQTDGTGTLGGGTRFIAGGGVTETAGIGGGVYVPLGQPANQCLLEVEMTPNDFAASGSFSIGFLETVDSGYFQNNNSDDALKIRYILSGVNAGKIQFSVYNEGVAANTTYSGLGAPVPDANETIRLSLSYDRASGEINASAYNLSAGHVVSSKTITVPGLSDMDHAGFGWVSIPDQTAAPSANPGVVSGFKAGDPLAIIGNEVSGETADPDGDGATNYEEYVAGTDPLSAASYFAVAADIGGNTAALNWQAATNRLYDIYWTTNLLQGFEPLETGIAWPQSAYTNALPDGVDSGFYQIKVRRP